MISLLKALLATVVGIALGLWVTSVTLVDEGPFGATTWGRWNVASKAGSADADPYTRASLARSGEIPLALGEGLSLTARVDDEGRALAARCVYRIGPNAPAARYWTLGVVDRRGFPIDNAAGRFVLRSSEIARNGDGSFAIWVSAGAHSGNWLPIGAPVPFSLVLRLYDTPLSATAGGVDKALAPQIRRENCA